MLTAVSAGVYATLWLLEGPTPMGMLWARVYWRLLIVPIGGFAAIFVLMQTLDFGLWDFVRFAFYGTLVQIIIQTLGLGIAAGLYNLGA